MSQGRFKGLPPTGRQRSAFLTDNLTTRDNTRTTAIQNKKYNTQHIDVL